MLVDFADYLNVDRQNYGLEENNGHDHYGHIVQLDCKMPAFFALRRMVPEVPCDGYHNRYQPHER